MRCKRVLRPRNGQMDIETLRDKWTVVRRLPAAFWVPLVHRPRMERLRHGRTSVLAYNSVQLLKGPPLERLCGVHAVKLLLDTHAFL